MKYNEKLSAFFKMKGLKQKEVAIAVGFAPAMISRYLGGTSVFPPDFLTALLKSFPEIDLKYIFSEDDLDEQHSMSEPSTHYGITKDNVLDQLEEIESKLKEIRTVLARKSHDK